MDHAEAREVLEIAAAEPDGLERLMAGDTPDAAALAGHLVGCRECTAELGRLRRIERLVRGTVSEIPPPELRERTLAFVRAVGRDRSAALPAAAIAAPALEGADVGGSVPIRAGIPGASRPAAEPTPLPLAAVRRAVSTPRRRAALWVASVAAAVVFAVIGTSAFVGASKDALTQQQQSALSDLAALNAASIQLGAAPDARRVNLVSPTGSAQGQLVFAPSQGEMAVTAVGLTPGTGPWTYRCWAVSNGQKRLLGWMHVDDGVAYWVGKADGLDTLGPGTQFGVSRVDQSTAGSGEVVLQGTL